MENKPIISDVLGIAPYGEATKLIIQKSLDGIGLILGKICLPVAEEFGLLFKDKVRIQRLNNFIKIINKSNGKFDFNGDLSNISIHPRILNEVIDSGSWCDDNTLQEMWAGLIVSSLENGEAKGKNVLFLESLKKLTPIQAKIIEFACRNCKIVVYKSGLILGSDITVTHQEMMKITGEGDVQQLDAELDNLRANELIGGSGGFNVKTNPLEAEFCPSTFLLQLYAKTQGHQGLLSEFYMNQIVEEGNADFKQTNFLVV
ncbi:Abi-alpha family protein [Pedobacter namyangjuensis]|uniref:Abi-alpha family protein n=1 Tax=Pedobacter namyangjuensis TaxID=600626 RepID=UPI000DE42916|nr:Abi-alpha family protein [Pedobacter namyangjuensis]